MENTRKIALILRENNFIIDREAAQLCVAFLAHSYAGSGRWAAVCRMWEIRADKFLLEICLGLLYSVFYFVIY